MEARAWRASPAAAARAAALLEARRAPAPVANEDVGFVGDSVVDGDADDIAGRLVKRTKKWNPCDGEMKSVMMDRSAPISRSGGHFAKLVAKRRGIGPVISNTSY